MPFEEKRSPNLLSLVIVFVGVIAVIAYMMPVIASGDFTWFIGGTSAQPKEYLIWQQGTALSVRPGDPDFAEIDAEVRRALNNIVAYNDFGPSEETLAATRNGLALEVLFGEPTRIRTQWNMGKPTRLLFPLSGYYLPDNRFFLGEEDRYRAGGPRVDDVSKLVAIVTAALDRRGQLLPTPTPAT